MKLPNLQPDAGPIIGYIEQLPTKERDGCYRIIQNLLRQTEGAMFLEILQKATINRTLPVVCDPRALDALNAQSLIAHDLRRIVNDEDYIAVGPKAYLEHGGTRRRRSAG